jgi:hypothetical protein
MVATDVLSSMTYGPTIEPEEIGAALAREFIQAQWLRIHIGLHQEMTPGEMDNWCPLPRMRFRLPPWWQAHDLTVDNDEALFEIYRSFATELNQIARSSDDPVLNKAINVALIHIVSIVPESPAPTGMEVQPEFKPRPIIHSNKGVYNDCDSF